MRNAIAYADAGSLRVELTVNDGVARLVVSDDGRGFDAGLRELRLAEGHLGLSLVEELARRVRRQPGDHRSGEGCRTADSARGAAQ